jgi:hypothetical protein
MSTSQWLADQHPAAPLSTRGDTKPSMLCRAWAMLQDRLGGRRSQQAAALENDPQLVAMRQALRFALDRQPTSRSTLRHLVIFEKTLRRHGAGAFDKLPSSFLYRVNQQLGGMTDDAALRDLAGAIDRTLARRMDQAEKEFAFVSSLEFSTQVEVEEVDGDDALREFAMLWQGDQTPGSPLRTIGHPHAVRPQMP